MTPYGAYMGMATFVGKLIRRVTDLGRTGGSSGQAPLVGTLRVNQCQR
jgi:hypothetical protein